VFCVKADDVNGGGLIQIQLSAGSIIILYISVDQDQKRSDIFSDTLLNYENFCRNVRGPLKIYNYLQFCPWHSLADSRSAPKFYQ